MSRREVLPLRMRKSCERSVLAQFEQVRFGFLIVDRVPGLSMATPRILGGLAPTGAAAP